MNVAIITTLIQKDLMMYFRNRFFALVTVLGLVAYTVIYLLLPSSVNEELTLALYAPGIPDVFLSQLSQNDITIANFESDEALQQAIIDDEYIAGLALPQQAITAILTGRETTIDVYFASDTPQEAIDALQSVLRLAFNELSYRLRGDPLQLTFSEEILGPDMTGRQIAARDRLLPLMAIFLLVLEMLGLGSLVAEEIERGTLRAVLITPATVTGVFIAKGAMGILLGFGQAALLMAITGTLAANPLLLLTTLLIASVVVTGIGFLLASVSRDMMGVMSWGILIIFAMLIPAYGVVFPGTTTAWVKVIPSYYMLDTIHRVVNFGMSWDVVTGNLLVLLAMGVVFMGAGIFVVERKMS